MNLAEAMSVLQEHAVQSEAGMHQLFGVTTYSQVNSMYCCTHSNLIYVDPEEAKRRYALCTTHYYQITVECYELVEFAPYSWRPTDLGYKLIKRALTYVSNCYEDLHIRVAEYFLTHTSGKRLSEVTVAEHVLKVHAPQADLYLLTLNEKNNDEV
jgi:hypothetical protein